MYIIDALENFLVGKCKMRILYQLITNSRWHSWMTASVTNYVSKHFHQEENLLENTELTTKINFKILHKILVTLYKCFLGFIFVAVASTRISHLAF